MKKLITTASLLAIMAAGPAFAQTASPDADPAKPSMGDTTNPSGTTTVTPGAQDDAKKGAQDMEVQRAPDLETTPGSAATAPSIDADKSLAADNVTGGGPLQVSELMGAAVRNSADESIGTINDILLSSNGEIESVIVGVGGFLGLGEKNVALKFSELRVDNSNPNEPKVTSTATSETLAAAPEWNEPNASGDATR